MFIETHILQNFAPSNLNRDDTGNPKDTDFGGVRRARISSQCIKRAIRMHPVFAQTTKVELAMRTRWITRLLTKPLIESGKSEEKATQVSEAFARQYCGMEKDHTNVLLYLSTNEIRTITQEISSNWDEILKTLEKDKCPKIDEIAKDLFKSLKNRTGAPDIALFGRMLAENPDLNINAACQVAHAISTHRVSMDMDFYTAVDDLTKDDETGAAMMGVVAFNSSCFYRYARIDWEQLISNLGGDSALGKRTVEAFLRACILAVPTGKQNNFAAQNPPDFILGVARSDGESWSLANAFEQPVRTDKNGGYLSSSILALDTYWGNLIKVYGGKSVKTLVLNLNDELNLVNLRQATVPDREKWINGLLEALPKE